MKTKLLLLMGILMSFQYANAQSWDIVNKVVETNRTITDEFGSAVDVEGDWAVVGAMYEEMDQDELTGISSAGAVFILKRENGIWVEKQKITADDRSGSDAFGSSVEMEGDFVFCRI